MFAPSRLARIFSKRGDIAGDKGGIDAHLERMTDALYTKDILRLAADIPLLERLEAPGYSVTKVSPICGSRVKVDADIENGTVKHFGQEVRACALGQASAAILGESVRGQSIASFPALAQALKTFLKGDGPAPAEPWAALAIFAAAKAHKGRHASILLPFEAMAEIAKAQQQDGQAQ